MYILIFPTKNYREIKLISFAWMSLKPFRPYMETHAFLRVVIAQLQSFGGSNQRP